MIGDGDTEAGSDNNIWEDWSKFLNVNDDNQDLHQKNLAIQLLLKFT